MEIFSKINLVLFTKLPNGDYYIETNDGLIKITNYLKTLEYDKEFIKNHKYILKLPFKNKHKIVSYIHKQLIG